MDDLPTPDDRSIHAISDLVYRHTGIHIGPSKAYFLVGRLGRLYQSLRCADWGDLASRIETASPDLVETFVQSVVIAETRFFRDELPFRALAEKIAPEIAAQRALPAPLRIWSAGCSTGQEPYSAVMALWDRIESGLLDVEVWATDISANALEAARRGVYEPFELNRGLPPEVRCRFFEEARGGAAKVRSEIRARVRFERLNLCVDAPPRRDFDVVFCRNVAIYFDRAGKDRLYRRLADAIGCAGYLILGGAETPLGSMQGFETVYFGRYLLFRKATEVADGCQNKRAGSTRPKGASSKPRSRL